MTRKLFTRKQTNQRYSLDYCSESYRRWERAGLLTPIKVGKRRSARVYYAEDEIIALFEKH
jgi:hypothetical protein